MNLPAVIFVFLALLMLAMVLEPLARMLRLPFAAVLVATGFFGSEWLVAMGIDTGLRWYYFHDLVFFVILPVLIFEAALHMNVRLLLRNLVPVLVFAIPVTLLATAITASLVYAGIHHPAGFPWLTAIIAGTLLSATDPIGVLDLFRESRVPARLSLLVEGESLLNDGVTIVLFSLLLSLAGYEAASFTWTSAIWSFLQLFVGGALVGAAIGLVAIGLWRLFRTDIQHVMISVTAAYVAFLLAEAVLHLSGVMATLACGLVLGSRPAKEARDDEALVDGVWRLAAWIANSFTFLLVGVTITVAMFSERWLAMLIGIGAVVVARAVGIFGSGGLMSLISGIEPVPRWQQTVIFWGGLRGAVTLALALSLPVELEGWWTVQAIAYGVVLFSLAVQAPAMTPLLRWVGRQNGNP